MVKATYQTLRDSIEAVFRTARPLSSDPQGPHYYVQKRDWNKHLVELEVLGLKKIVPDYEAAPTLGRHYPTGVWPVNYERAEQILDRLIQIERRQGTADERYRMRDKLKKKLKNLRVDLEELR